MSHDPTLKRKKNGMPGRQADRQLPHYAYPPHPAPQYAYMRSWCHERSQLVLYGVFLLVAGMMEWIVLLFTSIGTGTYSAQCRREASLRWIEADTQKPKLKGTGYLARTEGDNVRLGIPLAEFRCSWRIGLTHKIAASKPKHAGRDRRQVCSFFQTTKIRYVSDWKWSSSAHSETENSAHHHRIGEFPFIFGLFPFHFHLATGTASTASAKPQE